MGRLVGMQITESAEKDARWTAVSKAVDRALDEDDNNRKIILA